MPTHPTLHTLLRNPTLQLRLVGTPASGTLDRPVQWVHSTDLRDPTPFLADNLVLLTTGSQFHDVDDDGSAAAHTAHATIVREYVQRLHSRGVVGLGFGTEVHRAGIPAALITACADYGVPLFEVPYRVPFIAVARAHSDATAEALFARRAWALSAQRALALAALRARPLEQLMTELSHQLDAPAILFDAAATPLAPQNNSVLAPHTWQQLRHHIRDVLARGTESGQTRVIDDVPVHTFTLGRSGHLRGAVAVASGPLDEQSRTVVTSALAMAALALEQGARVHRSIRMLHAQLTRGLLSGNETTIRAMGAVAHLPEPPLRVAIVDGAPWTTVFEWAERLPREITPAIFVGEYDGRAVLCLADTQTDLLHELTAHTAARIGVSDAVRYANFSGAYAQARTAVHDSADTGITFYQNRVAPFLRLGAGSGAGDGAGNGGGAGNGDGAGNSVKQAAQAYLARLRAADDAALLEQSVRAWFIHDAHFEDAARTLHIHRHTLRARIRRTGELLGRDLTLFSHRAEVWAALQLSPSDAGPGPVAQGSGMQGSGTQGS
ncbi:PucR family transcriptional regulator [Microbacterium sp. YY-01]|uniref:PucR family transcriptional regulator n=1 Tax=Microbacterium sp. YY-01 TaxID=3421634 RepID=UPI003D17949B